MWKVYRHKEKPYRCKTAGVEAGAQRLAVLPRMWECKWILNVQSLTSPVCVQTLKRVDAAWFSRQRQGHKVKLARLCLAGNTYRSDWPTEVSIQGVRSLTFVNKCPVGRLHASVGTGERWPVCLGSGLVCRSMEEESDSFQTDFSFMIWSGDL